ncbi:HNH endonuclease family protein [Nocardia australiensis]|uniref:HNH endonuclease family protein n=1 Tax=Nocardia australiensis TaxID=2887191 RepID=UPI001D137740|nr:HNH endonuclease family protein [Nocardia australiensis]
MQFSTLAKLFSSRGTRRVFAVGAPILLAVVVAIVYEYVDDLPGAGGKGPGTANAATVSGKDVSDLVGKLTEAPESPMTGYSREKFPHWDTNKPDHGFGDDYAQYSRCTSRDAMMLRDATGNVTLDPRTCKFTVGKDGGWQDQYGFIDSKTGQLKPYKWMTDPSGVDADHIVALAEAWRSGADKFDNDTRRHIANDAVNLVASDPSANRSKGDQDVATYLPPGNYRCGYLDRYVKIKIKYALTVDPAEHTALRNAVDDCVRRGEFK